MPEANDRIGPYALVRKLGAGGMGEVWLAEQSEPVQRRVALKLIRGGLGDASLIERFEAERQILTRMEHAAIAPVLDAGTTADGRPYFVMEYVEGLSITEYCERKRLDTGRRIELFRQVCEGVQHAHRNAIVHRDLKPSNILITERDGTARAKIIDFGAAKALDRNLAERRRFTEQGLLIGTPEYMSPEQARADGGSVDTRSDVYSLGVVLYELLAGALPLDSRELRKAGVEELLRQIRESEPPRPSERATTVGGLARTLRGDLDWIVMKALAKEPDRRYDSPAELATDLERFLAHQPVDAGPPSATYRLRKFVRRHRAGVTAACLIAAALVIGTGVAGYGLLRALRSEQQARRDAATAQSITSFLAEMFELSDPSESRGRSITARELLDRGVDRIGRSQAGDPITRGKLMATMGHVYFNLGLRDEARGLLERATEIQRVALGESDGETLDTKELLAGILLESGELDEGARLMREVLDGTIELHGESHPLTAEALGSMGTVHWFQGDYARAYELFARRIEIFRELGIPDTTEYYIALGDAAAALRAIGRPEEALAYDEEAFEGRLRTLGLDHPDTIDSQASLGIAFERAGRLEESEAAYRKAITGAERVLGPDHPDTLRYKSNLSSTLTIRADYDAAEPLVLEVLEARRRTLGEEHPSTMMSREILGVLLLKMERLDRAREVLESNVAAYEKLLGRDHPTTLNCINNLAAVYHRQLALDDAARLYREAFDGQARSRGEHHPRTLTAAGNLADVWREAGRLDEALALLEQTLASLRAHVAPEHPLVGYTLGKYGDCLVDMKRYDEAEPILLEAYEKILAATGPKDPVRASVLTDLIQLYEESGREAQAEQWRVERSRIATPVS